MSYFDRDLRLEKVIQRLEESVFRDPTNPDRTAHLGRAPALDTSQPDFPADTVPGRVRTIVARSIGSSPHNASARMMEEASFATTPSGTKKAVEDRLLELELEESLLPLDSGLGSSSVGAPNTSMGDENRMLQRELNRVEDLLSETRAERDELAIKYNAVCEKLGVSGGNSDPGLFEDDKNQKNLYLRRQLEDDHAAYKRKLQVYQEGLQRQAQLVQKLQAKIHQYKKKTSELEIENGKLKSQMTTLKSSMQQSTDRFTNRLETTEARLRASEDDHNMDLETALIKLEEEQQRSESLSQLNSLLRDQLDQATQSNQSLTLDVQRLSNEWQAAQQQLDQRETEWRQEEATFNEYCASEHSRLLALWRTLVDFRRRFQDMKSQTDRDLGQIRHEVSRVGQSMTGACHNLAVNQRNTASQLQRSLDQITAEKISMEEKLKQTKADGESLVQELKSRLQEANANNGRLNDQLTNKNRCHGDERPDDDSYDDATRSLLEETENVHQALKDIAQVILLDADSHPEDSTITSLEYQDLPQVTLQVSPRSRSLSPSKALLKRGRRACSPQLAVSTYTAVQSALNKKTLQIQDIRSKLTSARETAATLKKQLDDSESERRRLEHQIMVLREEFDTNARDREEAARERDRYKLSLTSAGSERYQVEQQRDSLLNQVSGLQADLDRLHAANRLLESDKQRLMDQKDDTNNDLEKLTRDNGRMERSNAQLEDRISALKEELAAVRESMHRALLDRDVIEHEKKEIAATLRKVELTQAGLELTVSKLKTEESSLQDSLSKLESERDQLLSDVTDLKHMLALADEEKCQLAQDKIFLEQEKAGMKEELVHVEQEKQELDNQRNGLLESFSGAELTRERVENELTSACHERLELVEKLGCLERQKASMSTELGHTRRELDRQSANVIRLSKEREDGNKSRAELLVQLEGAEREVISTKETLEDVRSEKDALESSLFETRTVIGQLESRRDQLEAELTRQIANKERLTEEIIRARQDFQIEFEKVAHARDDLQTALNQSEERMTTLLQETNTRHSSQIDELVSEKQALLARLETEKEQALEVFREERDELALRLEKEREDMSDQLASLQRERDDCLLTTENEKQHTLSLLEQERSQLLDRLSQSQEALTTSRNQLTSWKSESEARHSQDRELLNQTNLELRRFRDQLEETCCAHDQEMKQLANQVSEQILDKDQRQRELSEVQLELKVVQDLRDKLRKDLLDAHDKHRQSEEEQTILRKDLQDLKRLVVEEEREKEALERTNSDQRDKIRDVESEKIELVRQCGEMKHRISVLDNEKVMITRESGDLRSSLRSVEKARMEARKELQELTHQIKRADNEREKLANQIQELNNRIALDEAKEEESRRDLLDAKQFTLESQTSKEALRKEMAVCHRRIADFEGLVKMKERENHLAEEDHRRELKKLDDNKKNSEMQMERCNSLITELRTELSGAEGRITALNSQLTRAFQAKKDAESRLSAIHSCLRRLIGFKQSTTPGARFASLSPQRRSRSSSPGKEPNSGTSTSRTRSPSKSQEQVLSDIDPEAVRLALRNFVQQLVSTERERDEALHRARSGDVQLSEMTQRVELTEARLQQLQTVCSAMEQEKLSLDTRLHGTQSSLTGQEERWKEIEKEKKALVEKMGQLERQTTSWETEKKQLNERIEKLKISELRHEDDKKCWKKSLDDAENRCTQLELVKRAMEGDLQRIRVSMVDREADIQNHQERNQNLLAQVHDLESKAQCLQLTIDRLNMALSKAEAAESQEKDRVQHLTGSLAEHNCTTQALHDRLGQVQKSLATSDQDRRLMQERVESSRVSLTEAKEHNYQLQSRLHSLQTQLTEAELRKGEVESESRKLTTTLQQKEETEQDLRQRLLKATADKSGAVERLGLLQKTISDLDSEKKDMERSSIRLEKDKAALRKTLEKMIEDQATSRQLKVFKGQNYPRVLHKIMNISTQTSPCPSGNSTPVSYTCYSQRSNCPYNNNIRLNKNTSYCLLYERESGERKSNVKATSCGFERSSNTSCANTSANHDASFDESYKVDMITDSDSKLIEAIIDQEWSPPSSFTGLCNRTGCVVCKPSENSSNLQRGENNSIDRGRCRPIGTSQTPTLRQHDSQVERERMRSEDLAGKTEMQRTDMDIIMRRLEEENNDLQRQLKNMQMQLNESEECHSHRLMEMTSRHREENDCESERTRLLERNAEMRERAHRQQVKGLEEQVKTLKDQLAHEVRKRSQNLVVGSTTNSTDMAQLRSLLDLNMPSPSASALVPQKSKQQPPKMSTATSVNSLSNVSHAIPTRLSPTRHRSPCEVRTSANCAVQRNSFVHFK